jgi:hypothetical protein
MDSHDAAALAHYTALIELRYPPTLAALLAAQRYAHGLGAAALPLPAVRDALAAVADREPALSREAGRARVALDEAIGVPVTRGKRGR